MPDYRPNAPADSVAHTARRGAIPNLLSDLVSDLSGLLRGELRLARAEMTEAFKASIRSLELLLAGGMLLLIALFMGAETLAILLVPLVGPPWAGGLVALGFAIPGVVLLMTGLRALASAKFLPDRSIAQLERDLDIAKEQL